MNENVLDCLAEIDKAGFQRISTKISLFWGEPELVTYLDSLIMIDERRTRKGFPPIVLSNLLKIYNYYTSWQGTTVINNGYEVTYYN